MAEHKALSQAHCPCRNLSRGGDAASGPGGCGSTCCEGCSWGMVGLRSLFQSPECSCFVGRGATHSSGGSDVNESVAKSTKKMPGCCCLSERLYYSLPVSKESALGKLYCWPEQVLTQAAQVCCSSGLAKMEPSCLLWYCRCAAGTLSDKSFLCL